MLKKAKYIFLVLFGLLEFAFQSTNLNAQAFRRDIFFVDGKFNIGAFPTSIKITDETGYEFKENKKSTIYIFPAMIEYGIKKKFGVALKYQYNQYAQGDSASFKKQNSSDICGILNYHFYTTYAIDFLVGIQAGLSSFNIKKFEYYGNVFGPTYTLNLEGRYYFGMHLGVNLNLAYTDFEYQKGKLQDKFGNYYELSFNSGGFHGGLGIIYKF